MSIYYSNIYLSDAAFAISSRELTKKQNLSKMSDTIFMTKEGMNVNKKANDGDHCDVFCYDEQKVKRVQESVKNEPFAPLSAMFKALADETRLKIAYALTTEQELCVCDVSHIIGSSTATASHHLRQLKQAGVAKSRKDGKWVFYSLQSPHIAAFIEYSFTQQKTSV